MRITLKWSLSYILILFFENSVLCILNIFTINFSPFLLLPIISSHSTLRLLLYVLRFFLLLLFSFKFHLSDPDGLSTEVCSGAWFDFL